MFKDDDDYSVGYGRPPRNSRFQSGKSGNPKGRPRGSKSLAAIFHRIINEKVQVKGPHGTKAITKFEAGLTQLANMAATGDKKAIRELMQWRRTFPELEPSIKPPVLHVHFVRAENGKPSPIQEDEVSQRHVDQLLKGRNQQGK
jgi:hypothetical protein